MNFSIRKKHKYVAKVGDGKYAKYFYSQKEYQAYLNSNKKAINQLFNK